VTAPPMRLRWVGSAVLMVLGTAIFLAFALWSPEHREFAARAYVIFLGALLARLLTRAVVAVTWAPEDPSFDLAMKVRLARGLPSARDPAVIEQEIGWAMKRALELHHRLRPRLRGIAADRLTANHGVSLDQQMGSARRLLGEEAWELLRPDREPPVERFGPGLPLPVMERIVTAVERL
jgi:hypothetical protein